MNFNYYIKPMSLIFILISIWYFLYANNKQKKNGIDFSDYSNDFLFFQQVDIFYLSAREIRTKAKSIKSKEKYKSNFLRFLI